MSNLRVWNIYEKNDRTVITSFTCMCKSIGDILRALIYPIIANESIENSYLYI